MRHRSIPRVSPSRWHSLPRSCPSLPHRRRRGSRHPATLAPARRRPTPRPGAPPEGMKPKPQVAAEFRRFRRRTSLAKLLEEGEGDPKQALRAYLGSSATSTSNGRPPLKPCFALPRGVPSALPRERRAGASTSGWCASSPDFPISPGEARSASRRWPKAAPAPPRLLPVLDVAGTDASVWAPSLPFGPPGSSTHDDDALGRSHAGAAIRAWMNSRGAGGHGHRPEYRPAHSRRKPDPRSVDGPAGPGVTTADPPSPGATDSHPGARQPPIRPRLRRPAQPPPTTLSCCAPCSRNGSNTRPVCAKSSANSAC